MSDVQATRIIATILADYLPTKLAELATEAGVPAQTVAAVATGRHIRSDLVGQVGVWVEDSDTTQQFLQLVEYRDCRVVVEATVSALDMSLLDTVRSVWADAIRAVVKQRYRVSSDAGFYIVRRDEVLNSQSSARTNNSIRGALGNVLGALRQAPSVDQIAVRFTLGQRVSVQTDLA